MRQTDFIVSFFVLSWPFSGSANRTASQTEQLEYFSEEPLLIKPIVANGHPPYNFPLYFFVEKNRKIYFGNYSLISAAIDEVIESKYYSVSLRGVHHIVRTFESSVFFYPSHNPTMVRVAEKPSVEEAIFGQDGIVWILDTVSSAGDYGDAFKSTFKILGHCYVDHYAFRYCRSLEIERDRVRVKEYKIIFQFRNFSDIYYVIQITNLSSTYTVLIRLLTDPNQKKIEKEQLVDFFAATFLVQGTLDPQLITYVSRGRELLIFIKDERLYTYSLRDMMIEFATATRNCRHDLPRANFVGLLTKEQPSRCDEKATIKLPYSWSEPTIVPHGPKEDYRNIVKLDAFYLGELIKEVRLVAFFQPLDNGRDYRFSSASLADFVEGRFVIMTVPVR